VTITPEELLRALVLNEASDSYQPFEKIGRNSRALANQCGLAVTSATVVGVLSDLIRDGLVKAVWLSSREDPREVQGVPREADIPRVYYFQTEEGMRANATGFYPFDDSGNMLTDFSVAPNPDSR